MDSRNIPREIFHISLGATSCVPQEDGPSGYVEYFTRDVSLVHYRAILHSAAPHVILPINNCKLSLDATRLVTIYSCLSMVMVFYFEVICICLYIFVVHVKIAEYLPFYQLDIKCEKSFALNQNKITEMGYIVFGGHFVFQNV